MKAHRRSSQRSGASHKLEPLERRVLLSTHYVDVNSPGPTHDGSSWNTAYVTLPQALSSAVAGDVIRVADGIYKPTSSTSRTTSIQLKNGVSIFGGYAGAGAADPDARDVATNVSTLSGDIGAIGNNTDNSYHVVTGSNRNLTAVLDGFIITAGNANASTSPDNSGGGLYNLNGTPSITNCTFAANRAVNGGAVYNSSSSITLTGCRFVGNIATGPGGAMYNSGSSPVLRNCSFEQNAAGTGATGLGGAIYNTSSGPNLDQCAFTGNSAVDGGGVYSTLSTNVVLTNCTFSANTASSRGGGIYSSATTGSVTASTWSANIAASGGAAYNTGTSPQWSQCTFTQNRSTNGGAMLNEFSASPTITNCAFTENTVSNSGSAYGGAISIRYSSSPVLSGCSFTGNIATGSANGGAIYCYQASPTFNKCTMFRNVARGTDGRGGAVYVYRFSPRFNQCLFIGNYAEVVGGVAFVSDSQSFLAFRNCTMSGNAAGDLGGVLASFSAGTSLINCVLWGNGQSSGPEIFNSGNPIPSIYYSNVQGGYSGSGNINADPRFVRNPNPGPDLAWGTSDDDAGDLRTSASSPVVDAGENSSVEDGTTTDFAGNLRFVDVPTTANTGSGSSPIVDMGAYEAVPTLLADAGGPYHVLEGQNLVLKGRGASSAAGALQYAWDFTGDGLFDDANGPSPTLNTAAFDGGTLANVSLRVTDSQGHSAVSTTSTWVAPQVAYVDGNAQAGTRDGTSWANAFTSLQAALAVALPGQSIHVADGVYRPTTTDFRTINFRLRNSIALLGGYAGLGAQNPDSRDPTGTPSMLSGDIGASGVSTDNTLNLVWGDDTDTTAVLDGFTITDGYASGPSEPTSWGGGMYYGLGDPTIRNCTFFNNYAVARGGAMAGNGGDPLVENCTFVKNRSGAYAGAMYAAGEPIISNCSFFGNSAGHLGGALFMDIGSQEIRGSIFSGNQATAAGGAIYFSGSQAIVVNCTIAGNRAPNGSAIGNFSASPKMRNCILRGASPLFYLSAGGPTITNSDVQDGFPGDGNIDLDPQFIRNPSPGADQQLGTSDDDYGDLRLQATSSCLDAGSNASVPAGITTDLDGHARVVDFPGANDPGAIVDMGAYERVASAPTVRTGEFLFETAQQIYLQFSSNVAATLSLTDLAVQNLTTGQSVAPQLLTQSTGATEATWSFGAVLPDGNYRATLPAGSVADTYGNPLAADFTFDFFVLAGDADHDRNVDVADLGILASNWQQSPRTFSQGDFDYNGTVDVNDLGILASNWQQQLAPPAAPTRVAGAKLSARRLLLEIL